MVLWTQDESDFEAWFHCTYTGADWHKAFTVHQAKASCPATTDLLTKDMIQIPVRVFAGAATASPNTDEVEYRNRAVVIHVKTNISEAAGPKGTYYDDWHINRYIEPMFKDYSKS